jgi:hypothetical protein
VVFAKYPLNSANSALTRPDWLNRLSYKLLSTVPRLAKYDLTPMSTGRSASCAPTSPPAGLARRATTHAPPLFTCRRSSISKTAFSSLQILKTSICDFAKHFFPEMAVG